MPTEKKKKTLSIDKPKKKLSAKYKKELNEDQFNVVVHDKGPALVVAGAGSGKTRALTYRVAYLLEQGVNPDSIVLVTFTKKAAQEMISRVNMLAGELGNRIKAGTFHHLANIFLRRYAKTIGFNNNFTILDRADQKTLMKNLRSAAIPEGEKKMYPSTAVIL